MQHRLVAAITAALLSTGAVSVASADDLPFFDNPYLKGGGTTSGYGAYGSHATEGNAVPRQGAGPLSHQDGGHDSDRIDAARPGTGRFEGGTNTPCIGSTGFGSSNVIPGHKC
jgi:hypothetical protein